MICNIKCLFQSINLYCHSEYKNGSQAVKKINKHTVACLGTAQLNAVSTEGPPQGPLCLGPPNTPLYTYVPKGAFCSHVTEEPFWVAQRTFQETVLIFLSVKNILKIQRLKGTIRNFLWNGKVP